jgi:hypothetical protein
MKLPRSTYYYKSKNKPDDEQSLIDRIESIKSRSSLATDTAG